MADIAEARQRNALYEADFYEWTQEQARLLRERRFADLDLENLIDEVESVGRSSKRELDNRLVVLVAHLLKWKYQPGARSSGWTGTIMEQRFQLADLLRDSPSLRSYPALALERHYRAAHLLAAKETGIDYTLFPSGCPFSAEQVLDVDFFPREPDLLEPS